MFDLSILTDIFSYYYELFFGDNFVDLLIIFVISIIFSILVYFLKYK